MATTLGVKQVYPGRYEPALLLDLRSREGVTFSHCVPTILKMLLDADKDQRRDLRGWKFVIGGAPMPRSLAIAAMDRGIDVFGGYGMSETCPLLLISHVDPTAIAEGEDELDARTAAGRAVILADVRVVDEEMRDLPADGRSRGELVARAPWLTRGYLGNGAATRELWRGGFLHTGDIATRNSGGYFRIVDRIKDVIKSGGEWISSIELEELLVAHPDIAEAAVIGVADEIWGERPVAVLILRKGASADREALVEHL